MTSTPYAVYTESPCDHTGDARDVYVVAPKSLYAKHGKGCAIAITGSLSAASEIANNHNEESAS